MSPQSPADRWRFVLESYQAHFAPAAPWLAGMVGLVRDAAAHPRVSRLYPKTSHFTLCVGERADVLTDMSLPFVSVDVDRDGVFEVGWWDGVGCRRSGERGGHADALRALERFAAWLDDPSGHARAAPAADAEPGGRQGP
jgi:hypothetical protein